MDDNLARKIYAAKIAEEIADHYRAQKDGRESDNIVFAISGKWGEGKTVLLDLLEPKLKDKSFSVIRFNPWQYSQEDVSLKRSFLRIVKEKLESDVSLKDLYFDHSETVIDWKPILHTAPRVVSTLVFLTYFVAPVLLGYPIDEWWAMVNTALKSLWGSGVGGVIFTAIIIPILIKTIQVSSRKAQITTAEEFDSKFKELLKGKSKIVIFVDDLDRCTSTTVKVVLDSLRTFFHHPECSYVITGDHTVIERYAAEELNPKKDQLTGKDLEEGRRFLKKMFDVYWRLPLATPKVFKRFISEKLRESGMTLSDTQNKNINVFLLDDRLFERNPRHAKRFITALKFALQSVSLQSQDLNNTVGNGNSEDDNIEEQKISIKEILDNVDLLAKVLLIQEKFYPIYEKLVLNPEDIVKHENSLRGGETPENLTIDNKNVLTVILEKDAEALKSYANLVMLEPQFTNAENATIFDPTNFFSFSVATGLPSLKGPDEINFLRYLKSGQLAERLGKNLEAAPKDKRARFAQKALQIFGEGVDTEKMSIVRESLRMSMRINEWASLIPQWKEKLFSLPPDQQNAIAEYWWEAVLVKSPTLISPLKVENPAYLNLLWPVLEKTEVGLLHKDTGPELEKILGGFISQRPPVLKGVEIFFKKFGLTSLTKELDVQLVDPATCKVFLDSLQTSGLQDGMIASIVKKRLASFLNNFIHIDWSIANKDYLKALGLFQSVKENARKWIKDVAQLTKISERKDALEFNEEDKRIIAREIVTLIKKSAGLEFLDNSHVQSLLDKDDKRRCFESLKDVLKDNDESLEKRKQVAGLLMKSKSVWSGIEIDNVYEFLKEIRKFKLGKFPDLKDRPKEIIDSWGYNDPSDEKEEK